MLMLIKINWKLLWTEFCFPQIRVETQCDCIWRFFLAIIKVKWSCTTAALMQGFDAYRRRQKDLSLSLHIQAKHRGKVGICKPGREILPETKLASSSKKARFLPFGMGEIYYILPTIVFWKHVAYLVSWAHRRRIFPYDESYLNSHHTWFSDI